MRFALGQKRKSERTRWSLWDWDNVSLDLGQVGVIATGHSATTSLSLLFPKLILEKFYSVQLYERFQSLLSTFGNATNAESKQSGLSH